MNKQDFIKSFAAHELEYIYSFRKPYERTEILELIWPVKVLVDMGALELSFPIHELTDALLNEINEQLKYQQECIKDGSI